MVQKPQRNLQLLDNIDSTLHNIQTKPISALPKITSNEEGIT
jgi:hypothetical protein